MEIGEYLAQARKGEADLPFISLNALSQKSGIHASQINRIERGQNKPTIFTLVRICQALDIDLTHLLARIDQSIGAINLHLQRSSFGKGDKYLTPSDVANFLSRFPNSEAREKALNQLTVEIVKALAITTSTPNNSKTTKNEPNKFWFYPDKIDQDKIIEIYLNGGAVNIFDFGQLVQSARKDKSYSLHKIDSMYNFDYESLKAIEEGKNTRLIFEDVILLDNALHANGGIVATSWTTAQLYTGIISPQHPRTPYRLENWSLEETRFANYLVNLSRWLDGSESTMNVMRQSWIDKFRDLTGPINSIK